VALELAGIRPVAPLTLLSPAGLWRGRRPLYSRASLRASRSLALHAAGLLFGRWATGWDAPSSWARATGGPAMMAVAGRPRHLNWS